MAVDKALTRAPQGIEEDIGLMEGPELEIEIEDPEAVRIGVDGIPLLEIEEADEDAENFYENLAEKIEPDELDILGSDLLEDIKNDLGSRKDWEDTYKEGESNHTE